MPERFWWEWARWAMLLGLLLAAGLSKSLAIGWLLWGGLAFVFAARVGYKTWVGWPLALAGLLGTQCVLQTPPDVRQHDVEGHREYVEFVGQHVCLPAVQQGWETWQPPLYYIVAAAWRGLFVSLPQLDSFRCVQWLAAGCYLATVALAMIAFRRLGFNDVEACAGLAVLALMPAHVFFAARINNDVILPLLGGGVFLATAALVQTGERRWQVWLAGLLVAALVAKGSSLAIVGGALAVVFWSECRRTGWRNALVRTYLTGLPAGLWQIGWWARNAMQTGDPLYVNAALPDELRVPAALWSRLLSFPIGDFLCGAFYYDEPIRNSYVAAMITSVLYGEYDMGDVAFRCAALLRWGCVGLLLILLGGAAAHVRDEVKTAWRICLCLAVCQAAIAMTYAIQYPFACNQNARFLGQAFVPFAGLFGLGFGRWWSEFGLGGRVVLAGMIGAFLVGALDLYLRLVF